jgi:hypothetical protein
MLPTAFELLQSSLVGLSNVGLTPTPKATFVAASSNINPQANANFD